MLKCENQLKGLHVSLEEENAVEAWGEHWWGRGSNTWTDIYSGSHFIKSSPGSESFKQVLSAVFSSASIGASDEADDFVGSGMATFLGH